MDALQLQSRFNRSPSIGNALIMVKFLVNHNYTVSFIWEIKGKIGILWLVTSLTTQVFYISLYIYRRKLPMSISRLKLYPYNCLWNCIHISWPPLPVPPSLLLHYATTTICSDFRLASLPPSLPLLAVNP